MQCGWKQYAKRKKLNTKDHLLYNSIYVEYPQQVNSWTWEDRRMRSDRLRVPGVSLWGDEKVMQLGRNFVYILKTSELYTFEVNFLVCGLCLNKKLNFKK